MPTTTTTAAAAAEAIMPSATPSLDNSPWTKIGDISKLAIGELFDKCAEIYKHRDAMALSEVNKSESTRQPIFKYLSFEKVNEIITHISLFLLSQDFKGHKKEAVKIGLWMSPSFHMRVFMMACHRAGLMVVPVYDALGHDSVKHTFARTNVSAIIVDTMKNFEVIHGFMDDFPAAKLIIKTPSNIDSSTAVAESEGVINFETIMQKDVKRLNLTLPKVNVEDPCCIILTSGSTGEPKGVVVTHRNLMSVASAFRANFLPTVAKYFHTTRFTDYMFLPQAHIFGMVVELVMFAMCVRIAYPSGPIRDSILIDIKTVKPDILITVPIVLKRVHDKILMTVKQKSYVSQAAFKLANYLNVPYINKIIYKEARQTFGGNLKVICAGGAYVDSGLHEFIKNALGVYFVVGYGLSEGIVLCQDLNNTKCDLGAPFDFISTRLRDVADMNYYANNGQGELLIKGDSVFAEYYKDAKATAASFTEDGYFCTGDVMQVSKDNGKLTYKFIDRIKNIVKLSQGEYVAPEIIQQMYSKANVCNSGIYIHGDFHRSFLVAIGFIDRQFLPLLVKRFAPDMKIEEDFNAPEVIEKLKPQLIEKLEAEVKDIPSFQRAKKWFFTTSCPTVENGLLTPTQKQKRPMIAARFRSQIESMSVEHENLLFELNRK
ncbi:MAG: Long-chain-fatty-acid--CoA ligase 5 [Marteilia pararefringens]